MQVDLSTDAPGHRFLLYSCSMFRLLSQFLVSIQAISNPFPVIRFFVIRNIVSTNLLQGLLWFCLPSTPFNWVPKTKLWDCSQDLLSPYLPAWDRCITHIHTHTDNATDASTISVQKSRRALRGHNTQQPSKTSRTIIIHSVALQQHPVLTSLSVRHNAAAWQGWNKDRWWERKVQGKQNEKAGMRRRRRSTMREEGKTDEGRCREG